MVSYPQLSLLDVIPDDAPETGSPATVYDKPNVDHGHLLIETHVGDWMFVWTGGTSLRAYFPGLQDGIDLAAEQLRILGDYCRQMAERIECRRG